MKEFIGTKRILAKPMNRQEYNDYRGWDLPADENGSDEGYLVEYVDGGGPNHTNHDYISWSPKDVFDAAYQEQPGDDVCPTGEDIEREKARRHRSESDVRVTIQELHGSVESVDILRHTTKKGQVLRFAILSLDNGFAVTGRPSVAVDPANDDDEVECQIAIDNAKHELWPLLGLLKSEENK